MRDKLPGLILACDQLKNLLHEMELAGGLLQELPDLIYFAGK